MTASFFVGSILTGTVSSLILLGLSLSEAESGFVFPTLEGIRVKYAYPLLVSSMKTRMYEYVADDEDIDIVQPWIASSTSGLTLGLPNFFPFDLPRSNPV